MFLFSFFLSILMCHFFIYRGSSVNFLFCFVFYLFDTGSHVSQANFELTTNADKVDLFFLLVTSES